MNCHKPFDQEFLVLSLNRTWVMKDYKEHRKKLLFEREYAKLADTMPKIAAHKKITELTKQKAELSAKMVELRRLLTIHAREQYNINVKINLIKNGEDPDGKKKKFIMACPSEGCRGFLSSSYKCELCYIRVLAAEKSSGIIRITQNMFATRTMSKALNLSRKKRKVAPHAERESLKLMVVIRCGVLNVK